MENTENIKDPNQLDLFAGILLTTEQQEQVDRYIENQNKNIAKSRVPVGPFSHRVVDGGSYCHETRKKHENAVFTLKQS